MSDSSVHNARVKNDWTVRLGYSLLCGIGLVIASAFFSLLFASGSNNPPIIVEITSYFIAAPLLPGVGFMALFFSNSWQVVHEEPGALAFIPLVSVAVDSAVIFALRNYYLRRKQRRQNETTFEKSEKYVTLHLF